MAHQLPFHAFHMNSSISSATSGSASNFSAFLPNATWSSLFIDDEFPQEVQVLLSIIYSLTILLAVVGNVLVILVLLLGNRVKTELTVFLVNLAVADLCMACFCMPFTFTEVMTGRWMFGPVMCPLVSLMQITSVAVSIFTNMAIGIDRFWGVIYTFKRKLTRTRAKIVLVIIWTAAFTLAAAQLVVSRAERVGSFGGMVGGGFSLTSAAPDVLPGSLPEMPLAVSDDWICGEQWGSVQTRKAYTVVIAAFTYVIPLTVITFTYYKIGSRLWVRSPPGNAHQSRDLIILHSKRKIIKMVVALVLAFAICWLPLQVFNLLMEFDSRFSLPSSHLEEQIFFGIYIACHWLAMANSFNNPIIYSFLNESFRADLKALFWCLPCLKYARASQHTEGYTHTLSTRTTWSIHSRAGSRHSRVVRNGGSNTILLRPLTDLHETPLSGRRITNGSTGQKPGGLMLGP